ncbi:MAG TPA: DUF2232 domain-containing protein [Candidatus Omnitrophota bacterium]|nr:DUF2232 domain-containing protein [Candidatus Omnitrophota bacterium]
MTRNLSLTLAAGLLSALLYLSVEKGLSLALLSYLSPLPLMMAGLALGGGAVIAGGLVGAVAVAMVAGYAAASFLVVAALPALLVASRALLWRTLPDGSTEWYPPGLVLGWLTAAGLLLLLIIGVGLSFGNPDGFEAWVAHVIDRMLEAVAPEAPIEQRQQAVRFWQRISPGTILGSWVAVAAINAVGAQRLLVRLGQNRRPSPVYRELWLPDWLGLVLVVTAAVAMLVGGDVGYVAGGLAIVTLVPFAFLGLAVIHGWVAGRPNARVVLAVTYGLLILASGLAVVAVAGLGLVRFWTMRFRRGDSGGGMEG